MRPIKFRGKCIEEGDVMYGEFVYGDLRIIEDKRDFYLIYTINSCVRVDKNTIGQFTGLHDKNGVEIYEGDIVSFEDTYDYFGEESFMNKGKIEWVDDEAIFNVSNRCNESNKSAYDRCEVIGNIHDNPELLEGK